MPYAPTTEQTAKIRALIGVSTSILDDEAIALWFDEAKGNMWEAAALCCDALTARYSTSVTFSVEGLSIQNREKVDNFRRLAANLRRRREAGDGRIGSPSVLGISLGAMDGVDEDSDRYPSRARMGIDDDTSTDPLHDVSRDAQ